MAGESAQVRFGLERSEGVPGHDQWYTKFASESFTMERPYEQNPNIDPTGNETQGDNLQATGTGQLAIAGNSESLLPIRAHMHGYYEIATPAAGVRDWTLRDLDEVNDTPIAHYLDSLHFGIWRDERTLPSEHKFYGAKASQFEISVDSFKHVMMSHDFLFLRDTYMRVHEQAVNVAFTGEIHPRGHRQAGDESGDYYKFKVVTAGALGVAEIVWGKGAAAYGTTEYLTAAVMDVMNADDTRAGTRAEPFQILIAAGGVFTLNDEFYIYPTTPKPVAVFTSRPTLNATKLDLEFVVGGATLSRTIESFAIRHGVPREGVGGVGSKYFGTIDVPAESKHWWEIEFGSIYVDRILEQALISGQRIEAHAKFWGGFIGASGLEDFSEWTIPYMNLTAAGSGGVQSPGRLPENVTLRAYQGPDEPFCTEVHRNTVTSITPT